VLNGVGIAYRRLGQGEQALRSYREALDINRRLDQKAGIAANLTNIGQVELSLGRLDDALASYNESLELRREIGDRQGIGSNLLDLGNAYLDMGRDDHALQSYRDSLVIQRELGNELDEALCLNNIAAVYMERGAYGEALTNLEQALRIHEAYGIPEDLGLTLYNLGETTAHLGQLDDALDHYLGALEQWRQIGDQLGVAWARVGTGTIFGYQGRYGAARDSLTEAMAALDGSGEQGYWRFIVTAHHGLATGQDGDPEGAVGDLGAALAMARDMDNPALVAHALNFQGMNALYRGRADDARAAFEEALRIAGTAGDREQALVARLYLDGLAVAAGDAGAAAGSLAAVATEADGLGLRYLATQARLRHAEALLHNGSTDAARRELQAALNVSERLRLRALEAECTFVLARIDAREGDAASAARRYARTVTLLDEIRAESGSGDPLSRHDLRAMYDAAAAARP
jgi:tetratricopeptide (TPR) repeat protein